VTDQTNELTELRRRLAKLEAAQAAPRPRGGATNMVGAATYIGRSEEFLRRLHAQGKGPQRSRIGSRYWNYRYADLDEWMASCAEEVLDTG
jgi:predicted DNA-binding transcriptional regulator AlpA